MKKKVEKKYRKAGWETTVTVNQEQALDSSFSRDTALMIKFITDHSKWNLPTVFPVGY